MWLLVLMLTVPVPGVNPMTVLKQFATKGECLMERDRIGYAMADAYPHERDFVITCIKRILA